MLNLIYTVLHNTRKRNTQPLAAVTYIQHSRRNLRNRFNKIPPFYAKIPLQATHFFVIKEYICIHKKSML